MAWAEVAGSCSERGDRHRQDDGVPLLPGADPPQCNVAYIFNPKLTAEELLRSVCDEFHISYAAGAGGGAPTAKDYVDALNVFLLRSHAEGRNNVLIIDEAQMLSADVLEQLRLLTNLETNERKLL